MKYKYLYMAAVVYFFSSCGSSDAKSIVPDDGGGSTTEKKQKISYADPTIFLDNGTYYMSGTSQTGSQSSRGFTVLMSDDLKKWTTGVKDTYRFILGPEWESTYGSTGFWAPQWYKEGNTYYFLYTANEHVAIAHASAMTGVFTQDKVTSIDSSAGNIDPFLFKDKDGKYYLYHVRFGGGNFIWVAEFNMATGTIDSKTLKKCLDLTEPWERMYN